MEDTFELKGRDTKKGLVYKVLKTDKSLNNYETERNENPRKPREPPREPGMGQH